MILYILVIFLIFLFIISFTILFLWSILGFNSQVPFVPVPNAVLKNIYEALEVNDESTLYDLGCGEGRVLIYTAKRKPKAKYIGIENNPLPFFMARASAWWYRKFYKGEVKIIKADFFNHNLSDATHIFTYLYPSAMDDLLPKLDRELKPGAKLVSASFKFTAKQPTKEINLARSPMSLARKIYIYEF